MIARLDGFIEELKSETGKGKSVHNHEEDSNLCSSFRTGCSALALLGVAAPDAAAEAAAASRSRTAYTFLSRQVAKIDINAAPTHANIVILRLDT